MFSAASLIHARLTFKQMLLILSYVLLESSLLASIGNTGQIQDILAREEEDWNPHIGEETYPDMIRTPWNKTSRETRRAWGEIRQYMMQQNMIDSTTSGADLREMLGHLLLQIERLSAQGLNTMRSRRVTLDMPGMPFSERGILVLICMGVSVTTTPGGSVSLRALLADPDQSIIQEMCSSLPRSPLWNTGVSLYTLRDAFKSLDELFVFLSGGFKAIDDPNIGSSECNRTPPAAKFRREAWTYKFELCELQEIWPSPRGQSLGSRRTEEFVEDVFTGALNC
ncbi:hypothetical protein PENSTE_c023G01590 [Penicillium steckii]|uniref:Uncharacterized protein n=1 Tax=Penicillium steckii TaxID=303698 RepID=A0A1V6SSW8_9EURO|nr:hypothetical protein PENSTE_c023G01590 [Penicillium steckii]